MLGPVGAVPAAIGGAVDAALLLVSFALLLLGAEIFTNGVEWVGHKFDVSQGATGSVLAAVGTALPETVIPVIAIVSGVLSGDVGAADGVAIGAILGAPFMLGTIAMFLVGVAVYAFDSRREPYRELAFDTVTVRRDLGAFLVAYTLAVAAAFVPRSGRLLVGVALVVLYVVYVRRTLATGGEIASESLEDLHFTAVLERVVPAPPPETPEQEPSSALVVGQTLFALALIVVAAHLFVHEIEWLADDVLGIPIAVLALLVAPLATELPEKFNSVIWLAEDKDTLVLGNITGAMVFQGSLPVALGVFFTSWNLSLSWRTAGFLNALAASGPSRRRHRLPPRPERPAGTVSPALSRRRPPLPGVPPGRRLPRPRVRPERDAALNRRLRASTPESEQDSQHPHVPRSVPNSPNVMFPGITCDSPNFLSIL